MSTMEKTHTNTGEGGQAKDSVQDKSQPWSSGQSPRTQSPNTVFPRGRWRVCHPAGPALQLRTPTSVSNLAAAQKAEQ